ncbi:hypothetical protein Tco_0527000 [Tanacetum coccineum]
MSITYLRIGGKYVTIVKNSKDISTVSYVDLYTHLKSYEQHALKTLSKMNQTSGNADPLAYMAKATQSTSSPSQYVPPPPQYAPAPQQAPQSTNDAMLAMMNQIVNLLSGFQKQFLLPTTSLEPLLIQRPKLPFNLVRLQQRVFNEELWALLMEAKEKGAILDTDAEAFLADVECTEPYVEPLAITTTTEFEVSHEDAYDSNVDEAPHTAATFMANLMQTGPSTRQGTSNDTDFHSEVHTYDNHFFDNMNLQVSQEIHGGEQLDSDVDSVIDDHDNTIPYHQYQLNNKVESVPTDVSSVVPSEISVITILDDLRSQLEGHIKTGEEQSFANDSLKAEIERYKTQVQNLEKKSEKLKADKNALEESYLEELVWLRNTNKDLHKSDLGHRNPMYLKSAQLCSPALYELDKEYDQCVIDKKSLEIENKNLLIQNECFLAESVSKDICSVVLTSDIAVPMSVEPRSNCVKDHSRNLELEAEILKVKQLLVEKEKRCSFFKTKYQELELNFQKYKECFENPQLKAQIGNINKVSANPNLSTLEFQALETENTQFKEELTTVRIKSDSLRDENVSIKKRYQDLYKSKAESNSNVSSRATVPKKPKVLAPGLYTMTPKPTGRKFTLGDTCPLTMITKPEVVPLEKSGSVSNSEPSNNVIVTPRFSKKPLTSYKRKDRKLKDISTSSPPNTETKHVRKAVADSVAERLIFSRTVCGTKCLEVAFWEYYTLYDGSISSLLALKSLFNKDMVMASSAKSSVFWDSKRISSEDFVLDGLPYFDVTKKEPLMSFMSTLERV